MLKQGLNSLWIGLHHNSKHAYYTVKPDQTISSEQLLKVVVCDRFGTPSSCILHPLQKMPLTSTGEIDRFRTGNQNRTNSALYRIGKTISRHLARYFRR